MKWLNRKALLYTRVSSDDQKNNNSLSDQLDRLQTFCRVMKIEVVQVYTDDGFSARSFDRPAFGQILSNSKANRKAANLLLFTNWSRFSRAENMGDTYMMIDRLRKLNMEVQAIEQPIDFTIPESHLLLSLYIASPAVDNLRRASNTRNGIRRSLKDGRFINKAPFGYVNARDERNKPILTIIPERAKVIERIFNDYLSGGIPREIIMRARKQTDQPLSGNSTFHKIITNPVYAGLVRVPAYGDEPEILVSGIHKPIISEDVYYAAIAKLKYDTSPKPKVIDPNMPLRGMIACGNCHHQMTGGRSRGRHGGYYFYYRCLKCEGFNFSVKTAHKELEAILKAISLSDEQVDYFISEVENELKSMIAENNHQAQRLQSELKNLEQQLSSLETKYIQNRIDFQTYEKHYPKLRGVVAEKRLALDEIRNEKSDVLELYRATLPKLIDMNLIYDSCNFEDKQTLLKLLFPLGLFKNHSGYRTPELYDLFDTKAAMDAGLVIGAQKKDGLLSPASLQCSRNGNRIEPSTILPLLHFIQKLAA